MSQWQDPQRPSDHAYLQGYERDPQGYGRDPQGYEGYPQGQDIHRPGSYASYEGSGMNMPYQDQDSRYQGNYREDYGGSYDQQKAGSYVDYAGNYRMDNFKEQDTRSYQNTDMYRSQDPQRLSYASYQGSGMDDSRGQDPQRASYASYQGSGMGDSRAQDPQRLSYASYQGSGMGDFRSQDPQRLSYASYQGSGMGDSRAQDPQRLSYASYQGSGIGDSRAQAPQRLSYASYQGSGRGDSRAQDSQRLSYASYQGPAMDDSRARDPQRSSYASYQGPGMDDSRARDPQRSSYASYQGSNMGEPSAMQEPQRTSSNYYDPQRPGSYASYQGSDVDMPRYSGGPHEGTQVNLGYYQEREPATQYYGHGESGDPFPGYYEDSEGQPQYPDDQPSYLAESVPGSLARGDSMSHYTGYLNARDQESYQQQGHAPPEPQMHPDPRRVSGTYDPDIPSTDPQEPDYERGPDPYTTLPDPRRQQPDSNKWNTRMDLSVDSRQSPANVPQPLDAGQMNPPTQDAPRTAPDSRWSTRMDLSREAQGTKTPEPTDSRWRSSYTDSPKDWESRRGIPAEGHGPEPLTYPDPNRVPASQGTEPVSYQDPRRTSQSSRSVQLDDSRVTAPTDADSTTNIPRIEDPSDYYPQKKRIDTTTWESYHQDMPASPGDTKFRPHDLHRQQSTGSYPGDTKPPADDSFSSREGGSSGRSIPQEASPQPIPPKGFRNTLNDSQRSTGSLKPLQQPDARSSTLDDSRSRTPRKDELQRRSYALDTTPSKLQQSPASRRSTPQDRLKRSVSNGLENETRVMEAAQIVDILRKKIAILSGGRDKRGGPILTFLSHGPGISYSPQDIMACVGYLGRIPSEDCSRYGFTVIVDNREGTWTDVKQLIKLIQQSLPSHVHLVLVVKSEDKRQFNLSFRKDKSAKKVELLFVTPTKLLNFITRTQLTQDFGGDLQYDHNSWLETRLAVERFLREGRTVSKDLDVAESQIVVALQQQEEPSSPRDMLHQHRHLYDSVIKTPEKVIKQGHELLQKIAGDAESGFRGMDDITATPDMMTAQGQVRRMLVTLEDKVDRIQDYWESRERELSNNVQFAELEKGFKKVVDWVTGPAEKLLASKKDIGDSYKAADELRKEQENLELKCTDNYAEYAELRHDADTLIKDGHPAADDIRAQTEYMDSVCRSYASRLERRRNLVITSVRFHRLAEELSQKLDELLELLCTDIGAEDVESAEHELRTLQEKCDTINIIAQQTLNEGQNLLDQMAVPIKNAFGKDITPDFSKHIEHVEKVIGELQERKLRCDELSDVRRLKLQQILQLRTCERDADQAIAWILELCDVMVTTHTDMGKNPTESERLQDEHKKFETTAHGTYEYGKQLLQAGLVLRRSLRFDLVPNNERAQKLHEAWKKFSQGINERASRLSSAILFHKNADRVLGDLEDLLLAVSHAMNDEIPQDHILASYDATRDQIARDYDQAVDIGQSLLDQMTRPVIMQEDGEKRIEVDDQEASGVIRSKLSRLNTKMRQVNTYWGDHERSLPQSEEWEKIEEDLKESNEWLRVRVNQMEPDLMEVGATLEEAIKLRQEHEELLHKLH
ncbi:uncharacterized protein LOC106181372, partial [Lingula anatina]|uniref:Uncharacterized protein LOC106181372 n=1 Tax=Lingula anatina TaxID=7574 RepID=A0A2R2MT62_LINAN